VLEVREAVASMNSTIAGFEVGARVRHINGLPVDGTVVAVDVVPAGQRGRAHATVYRVRWDNGLSDGTLYTVTQLTPAWLQWTAHDTGLRSGLYDIRLRHHRRNLCRLYYADHMVATGTLDDCKALAQHHQEVTCVRDTCGCGLCTLTDVCTDCGGSIARGPVKRQRGMHAGMCGCCNDAAVQADCWQ
jgi:hypothetical protein